MSTEHPARMAELALKIVDEIASGWDGCMYDAIGGQIDIGAAIRSQGEDLVSLAAAQEAMPSPTPHREAVPTDSTGKGNDGVLVVDPTAPVMRPNEFGGLTASHPSQVSTWGGEEPALGGGGKS